MKNVDQFKPIISRGRAPTDRYRGSYVNGPPAWRANRARQFRTLGVAGLALLGFLQQGKGVIDSFGSESSPCHTFSVQLSQGKVSQAQCMECVYQLGEQVSGTTALQFESKVCAKLPPDGDYSESGDSCPASGGTEP